MLAEELNSKLTAFSKDNRQLLGIENEDNRRVLIKQLVASIHRVRYIDALRSRELSPLRADPSIELFNPEMAAIIFSAQNDVDEAFWITFLGVHFGKNKKGGWRYAREMYSGLQHGIWTWNRVSHNLDEFMEWFDSNLAYLGRPGGGFGNHRKYESLKYTGRVIESYVDWVGPHCSHQTKIQETVINVGQDPRKLFAYLYEDMDRVKRFGRMGKFDFLAMIGKLGLAPIIPDSTYMTGATGPLDGARLLFTGNKAIKIGHSLLDQWLKELDEHLAIGMQAIEDALCNWQKSPSIYKSFRG